MIIKRTYAKQTKVYTDCIQKGQRYSKHKEEQSDMKALTQESAENAKCNDLFFPSLIKMSTVTQLEGPR